MNNREVICLQMNTYVPYVLFTNVNFIKFNFVNTKKETSLETLLNWHKINYEKQLFGRYIHVSLILKLLENLPPEFEVIQRGFSVEKRPIHSVTIGTGKTKILLWSQMHGNESTTTKALFDLFKAFQNSSELSIFKDILSSCTLCIIPILNPDGAAAYTRVNANSIDLNRDAQHKSQPESVLLWEIYKEFAPNFCFNLHGQRTIFGFEDTGTPSILSFLAPSADAERSITLSRKRSMQVIAHIHKELSPYLSENIGLYDDGFNIHCTGDTFQANKTPTILFEAGHFPNDYDREITRQYVFMAIVAALENTMSTTSSIDEQLYLSIPVHQKCYCDILFKNSLDGDVGIQFVEKLTRNNIEFVPEFSSEETTSSMFGHRVIDASGVEIKKLLSEKLIGKPDIRHLTLDDGRTITL
ncbi:M14 family zinc carboxypeptidase [uncultured Dokdonia sp.]|uniref:M14 family zinc carboxypeptidase n=1 Tax=uncultured Dokdonia sp. TaxID=575653 RepID=UPI0026036188|nr:M14 family zinc carboxypeptidase [uncultured Dokdonia sp.]